MPTLHLTNGETEEFDRIVVKEQGLYLGMSEFDSLETAYPESQVAEITGIDEVYDKSYLMSEEYSETRKAERSEPGETVTEFKDERRVMVELQIE